MTAKPQTDFCHQSRSNHPLLVMGFRSCNGVALSDHFFAGYTVVSGARPKCWQRQCRVRQVWFMTRKPVFSVKSVASNIIAAGLCFFLTLFLGVKNSHPFSCSTIDYISGTKRQLTNLKTLAMENSRVCWAARLHSNFPTRSEFRCSVGAASRQRWSCAARDEQSLWAAGWNNSGLVHW